MGTLAHAIRLANMLLAFVNVINVVILTLFEPFKTDRSVYSMTFSRSGTPKFLRVKILMHP